MFQCGARSSAFFCFQLKCEWMRAIFCGNCIVVGRMRKQARARAPAHLQQQFSATLIQSAIVKKRKLVHSRLMRVTIITLRESNHHRTSWRREMCASPTRLHKYQPSVLYLSRSLPSFLTFFRRINTVNSRYRNMSSFSVSFLLFNIHSSTCSVLETAQTKMWHKIII